MTFRLDQDAALAGEGGRYTLRISDGWGIGPIPNGGYLAFVVTQALAKALPHPDPLTITTHYLRPAAPGEASVEVETVRVGRTQSTGVVRLVQGGKEILRSLATMGELGAHGGPTREDLEAPPIPAIELCDRVGAAPPNSTFAERVEMAFAPGSLAFMSGPHEGPMALGGWIRLADGREPDAASLVLFADAFPPPVLHAVPRVWVPTIELTVHVRRRPAPGWLRGWFRTRALIDGYLEEDGELWDSSGRLVALSRQLARLPG